MSVKTLEFERRFKKNQERDVLARSMNKMPYGIKEALLVIIKSTGNRSDYFKSCITCLHWDDAGELCKLANARPPAPVICDGCEKYEDFDEIPF